MTTNYHYAPAFQQDWDPDPFFQAAVSLINSLGDKMPVLMFTGMSGCMTAAKLSEYLRRNDIMHEMLYVRKQSEESHGYNLEHSSPHRWAATECERVYIAVDDFISGGQTLIRMYMSVSENFKPLRGQPIHLDDLYILTTSSIKTANMDGTSDPEWLHPPRVMSSGRWPANNYICAGRVVDFEGLFSKIDDARQMVLEKYDD